MRNACDQRGGASDGRSRSASGTYWRFIRGTAMPSVGLIFFTEA